MMKDEGGQRAREKAREEQNELGVDGGVAKKEKTIEPKERWRSMSNDKQRRSILAIKHDAEQGIYRNKKWKTMRKNDLVKN